jgi:hypothetical protein
MTDADSWARETFGATNLGDERRTSRLVAIAGGAARRPSGRVSAVFERTRDREGAYDFLENPHVRAEAIAASMFAATAKKARGMTRVYVAIDGSSLSLTDEGGTKGFGPVGSPNCPVTGLMVMNAYAVGRDGVPLGLIEQLFWSRPPTEDLTPTERVAKNLKRPFEEKETARFVEAAENAIKRLTAEGATPWIVIDREGDNRDILQALVDLECPFTVRGGRWDRKLVRCEDGGKLHDVLDAQPSLGEHTVEIGRTGRRPARQAVVDVRAAIVRLKFDKRGAKEAGELPLYAVRVRENAPDGLEWLLYTNVPVISVEHAKEIVATYQARWRVEEFHRTWKQGECNVEDTQLRSEEAVMRWATILAAVAARIERMKYFARTTPKEPATVELTLDEIEALKLDQQKRNAPKRVTLPDMPTIRQATEWIAQLGGWIGPANGPPGSTTLGRGLERLGYLVEGIALARQPPAGGRRT